MKKFLEMVKRLELKLITFSDIDKHKVGHTSEPIMGMELERLPDNIEHTQFFWVRMKKGTEIPLNYSDCNKDLVLFSGKLINTYTQKELLHNKIMRLPKGQPHGFLAITDCVWFAQHYKP